MGKIVKKFFEYVKEDLNPSRNEFGRPDIEYDEDMDSVDGNPWGGGEGAQDEDELEYPSKPKMSMEEDDMDSYDDEIEEEDSGYEGGRMLQELARKLGKKVVNNEIEYNGSTITCYSEDNNFRLDDQIIGSNVQQALKNIQADKSDMGDGEIMERKSHRHTCKCGRCN